jgi:tRNA uridine 5-carboxymethylaminomethyl modification enzyme
MENIFDIAIIGGGHAGAEAAWISSQFNLKICLITSPGIGICSAPCNPSIGGVGKGQVVKELDALGGLMGLLADRAGIQYRTLNESKGFAVQSTRVQIDKVSYSRQAEQLLGSLENLKIVRAMATFITKKESIFEVLLDNGDRILSKSLVLTTGTFLNGKLHTGEQQTEGGRVDSKKSNSLNELLPEMFQNISRFKTGTPARLKISSIDFAKTEPQESDHRTRNFSLRSLAFERNLKQVNCYLTYTNQDTLEIIRANKERSPIFNGQISGIGPRYCPSIEDKAFRYVDKNVHHVFIEPESHELETVYPSGVSTSLPKEVQLDFLRTIKGFENCEIDTYGYAVEYDVVNTSELDDTLQSKKIKNLYFAGQVCGTSGYEEAAGQGFVVGANAALAILGLPKLILSRDESYIGVMIEDLITSNRDEPYRLFTARSENRLFIREDNSFVRMFKYRSQMYLNNQIDAILLGLKEELDILMSLIPTTMYYSTEENQKYFFENSYGPLDVNISLAELIKRPELNPITVLQCELMRYKVQFSYDVVRTAAISFKYSGYVNRMNAENEKLSKLNSKKIDIDKLLNSSNISYECKLRISKIRPENFGQLKQVDGIRPATLAYVAGNLI